MEKLCVLILLIIGVACSNKQDVAPVVDPTDFPLVTITPDGDYSNVAEGDILSYTITVDKFFDQDIDFSVIVNESSTGNAADIEVVGGTFIAYTSSTSLEVTIVDDGYPEIDESYDMEISAVADRSYNFQISPNSDVEILNFSVANVNVAGVLTVGALWSDDHDDWDLYFFDSNGNQLDGNVGATGSDPEVITGVIDDSSDDGTYDLLLDAWDVSNDKTTFEISIAKPDGGIEVISTDVSISSTDEPTLYGLYHVATLTKSGSNYTLMAKD